MGWTAPRTYTTGETITKAILDQHVRDNFLETGPAKVAAAGDLLYGSGVNALARLPIGTAGGLLVVSGGLPLWLAPGGNGALLYITAGAPAYLAPGGNGALLRVAAGAPAYLAPGTARQVPQVNPGVTDLEYAPSPQSVLTTLGDLLYASAANTLARLAIPTNDRVVGQVGGVPTYTRLILRSLIAASVANTAAETTMATLTIPGGTLGTAGVLCITAWGSYTNTSGANRTPIVRVKYGGVVIFIASTAVFGAGTNPAMFWVQVHLGAKNSATDQTSSGQLFSTDNLTVAWAAPPGVSNPGPTARSGNSAVGVNSGINQDVTFTWQHQTVGTETATLEAIIVEQL